jgi:putative DNA primase/helicase
MIAWNAPISPAQTADELAERLAQQCDQAGLNASNTQWSACCPVHDDQQASLSIGWDTTKVLLHCHAGCSLTDILQALGLTPADLFVTCPDSRNGHMNIVKVYDYLDLHGHLVHQTIRLDPKAFRQRRPDPAKPGGYLWNLKGIKPVLYHLLQVLEAIQRQELVYFVEGEKDADALQSLGLVATCNPMGAGKWRASYSDMLQGALCVILPDNDTTGRKHAEQVAHSLYGKTASIKVLALPNLPDKGDVSDWLQAGGTRSELETLVTVAPLWTPAAPQQTAPTPPEPGTHRTPAVPGRERFTVDEHGVWFTPPEDEDMQPADVWVCAPLHIVAATRDVDNNNHGHLLEFNDRHGHPQQWAMPLELLEERREYRKVLRRLGLSMSGSRDGQGLLQLYLEACSATARARCVDRVGWYGTVYVLPDTTLGETGEERLVLQTLDHKAEGYRQAGTLDGWRHEIAARCIGNSRLLLAISTAFAAALLALTHEESGGVHFRGASSEGKTTALLAGATVWGEPTRLERWRTTANALEGVALAHNDNLLCLDELKELDPREAGGVAYMLANGTGKRRGQPHGGTRPRLTWRLLFLSTGEMSLEQHIAEVGQRTYAGQEVRLVDVPADAGAGLGLFEDLHSAETGQAFAVQLQTATSSHYGHAGRAFVAALAQDSTGNAAQARKLYEGFVAQQVPAGASGQVFRVATRFGLIGAAGELATAAGLTDWPGGVALTAAARCFHDWLKQRGGLGNADEARALSQVKLFFERYGEARFKPWTVGKDDTCERCLGSGRIDTSYKGGICFDCGGRGTIANDTEPNRQVHDRAGFRRATEDGRTEFYVFPEVFHHEIAKGFEAQWLAQALLAHDLLYRAPDGKLQYPRRLPGIGVKRVYHFKAAILGEAGGDDSN